MNFEDIVDMDWLNSHTTDTSLPSPPPTTMNEDEEMIHYNDNEFSNSSMDCTPSTTTGSTTAAVTTILSTTTGGPIIMPTTEQIKQLIELAKRQLALREQQAQQQSSLVIDTAAIIAAEPTPEPDSPPPGTNMVKLEELFTTPTVSPESLIKTDHHILEHQEAVSLVEEAVVKMEPIEEETVVITTATTATNTTTVETEKETKETATKRRGSFASHISDEGPMSLEAYAETDGIDIKKLTSKERRQLRNKISARNFRVRRKEYITTLEGQVDHHKKTSEQLVSRLNTVEEENKQLKLQIDNLKRQNQSLLEASNSLNNKDLSILGSSPSDTYRQDISILVEC